MTKAELPRTAIERGQVAPVKLAHIVRRTSRFAEMRAWYQFVLQAEVVLQTDNFAFLTYDEEHHRVAILAQPASFFWNSLLYHTPSGPMRDSPPVARPSPDAGAGGIQQQPPPEAAVCGL